MGTPFITGGTVSITQRKKIGEWEHREVKAEFQFSTGEGEHKEIAELAANSAIEMVERLHNGAIHRGPGRPPGAKNKPVDPAAPKSEVRTVVLNPSEIGAKPARDPAAMEEDDGILDNEPAASSVVRGVVSDDPGAVPAGADPSAIVDTATLPDVSDNDLLQALAAKMKQFGEADPAVTDGGAKITRLVWSYVPQPKKSRDIPQAQRREFLAKLKELR